MLLGKAPHSLEGGGPLEQVGLLGQMRRAEHEDLQPSPISNSYFLFAAHQVVKRPNHVVLLP